MGGSDGARVVPDLAISLPAPTDAGRTYTFQLWRGVRYSSGVPIKPDDFRRALERDFKLGDPLALRCHINLVGGAACVARPARCDLSRGIVTNDAANSVTFHLVAPDPEFSPGSRSGLRLRCPPGRRTTTLAQNGLRLILR